VLRTYFDPERFIVKLTPMHETATAQRFGHETHGDYVDPKSYRAVAASLRSVGFEVLVFIASRDEDHGMITCGNAVLARALPINSSNRGIVGQSADLLGKSAPEPGSCPSPHHPVSRG
jgi:23S rRNA (adenine2503-C2)-methyltransferase